MTANTKMATHVKGDQPRRKSVLDLRASSLLAKWPIIGLSIFIFGSLMFGALTYNLFTQGPLLAWDKAIANTLPAIGLKGPAFVKRLMAAGFYMGKEVIMVLDILLDFTLYIRNTGRNWQW